MLNEFIEYLESQVGQPYVWGAQHTKLTPSTYVSIVQRREETAKYEKQALEFCRKKFAAGVSVLYASDCSGLGIAWLCDEKKLYSKDTNANGMMGKCTVVSGKPKKGYWLFRLDGSRASHIGYMVSDIEVIHAKGRAYGVVKEKYKSSYWHKVGIPKIFADEITGKAVDSEYTFYRLLKYGCKGTDVNELKAALLEKGYGGLTLSNGNFYSSTRKVVKQFQKDNGLAVDGIVGKNTYKKLGVKYNL